MTAPSSPAGNWLAGDSDNVAPPSMRSSTYVGGGFEQMFEVDPAGLSGLNRLVGKLNVLVDVGGITGFQLGRWRDSQHQTHSVLFSSATDLAIARLSLAL